MLQYCYFERGLMYKLTFNLISKHNCNIPKCYIPGLYSRGKSQILHLAVPVQLLLSFWETAAPKLQAAVHTTDTEEELTLTPISEEVPTEQTGETMDHDLDVNSQEQDEPYKIIGPEAIQIASSIVGTCLTQLCMYAY